MRKCLSFVAIVVWSTALYGQSSFTRYQMDDTGSSGSQLSAVEVDGGSSPDKMGVALGLNLNGVKKVHALPEASAQSITPQGQYYIWEFTHDGVTYVLRVYVGTNTGDGDYATLKDASGNEVMRFD